MKRKGKLRKSPASSNATSVARLKSSTAAAAAAAPEPYAEPQTTCITPDSGLITSTQEHSVRNLRHEPVSTISSHGFPKNGDPGKMGRTRRSKPVIDESSRDSVDSEQRSMSSSNRLTVGENNFIDEDGSRGAPELVAAHHSESQQSGTYSLEPRLQNEKTLAVAADAALLHNQRRMNKRELKALLKQTKKARSALDETLIATMDELALRFKGDCIIDPTPRPRKPIPVASPPPASGATTLQGALLTPTTSPTRRAVGGRRGSRRGGRGGRNRGKSSAATNAVATRVDIAPPDVVQSPPASWVPLLLPFASTAAAGNELLSAEAGKPKVTTWLNQLPDARVQRFTQNMQYLLTKHPSSRPNPPTELTTTVNPTRSVPTPITAISHCPPTSPASNTPTTTTTTVDTPNLLSLDRPPSVLPCSSSASASSSSTSSKVLLSNRSEQPPRLPSMPPSLHHPPPAEAVVPQTLIKHHTLPTTLYSTETPSLLPLADNHPTQPLIGSSQQQQDDDDNKNSIESNQPLLPLPRSNRGRPRGRFQGTSLRGARQAYSRDGGGGAHGNGHLRMGKTKVQSKSRVSRELRGLVTWDAVIAEQKRQQASHTIPEEDELPPDVKVIVAPDPVDATLAVAESLLAQAAVDGTEEVGPRPPRMARRTRQSSGQTALSTGLSETTSVVTTAASETMGSELPLISGKPGDISSTVRSSMSTASSSIASDLPTSMHLPGLDLHDEPGNNNNKTHDTLANQSVALKLDHTRGPQLQQSTPAPRDLPDTSASQPLSPSIYAAKYSPISVDHDTEPRQLPELSSSPGDSVIATEMPIIRHKRGRGRSKNKRLTPAAITPPLTFSGDSAVTSTSPQLTGTGVGSLNTTPGSAGSSGRRRSAGNAPQVSTGICLTPTQSIEPSANSVQIAVPGEVMDIPPPADLPPAPSSMRRAATSRHSALPPRKRYKAGIDPSPSADDLEPSEAIQLSQFHETNLVEAPEKTEQPREVHDLIIESGLTRDQTEVVAVEVVQPIPKRGRGRVPRRAVPESTRLDPITVSTINTVQPVMAEVQVTPVDRPKREAAAIGFASLVAANLNNNTTMPSSIDSPTSRLHGLETPTATTATTLGDKSGSADPAVLPIVPPHTPRPRGRPPKVRPAVVTPVKVPAIAVAAATSVITTDICTIPTDIITPSSISSGRRKRAAALAPLTPPTRVEAATTTPNSTAISSDVSISKDAPMDETVATDMTESLLHPPSETSDSLTQNTIVTVIAPEISKPTKLTNTRKPIGRKRRQPSTPESTPVHVQLDGEKQDRKIQLETNTSKRPHMETPHTKLRVVLPGRNSLFKGYLLSSSISLGQDASKTCVGPVCDLFLRFLNEPDPNEPNARLAAPIVYLPPPERYPEFYRFVISYTGTVSGVHFTDTFLRRLFTNPNSSSLCETTPPSDETPLYGVEFPSLCLASIAKWFVDQKQDGQTTVNKHQQLGLTDPELAFAALDPLDVENSAPLLDAAVESVLNVWEAFAGRRSWLGRRLGVLRSRYSQIRNECARSIAEKYNRMLPPLKATAVLNMPGSIRASGAGTKKKADRRALERGAEVIRCLCGFRVEGGHVMVQCDRCASWQHLPCLWWALNQTIKQRPAEDTDVVRLCQAALVAAQAAGSGFYDLGMESVAGGGSGMAPDASDLPYFCPVCLELPDLTLEYPRSLSAAMAMNDLDAVFSLQETTVEGEHEFWSLASPSTHTHHEQIRTDDYAFVSRAWFESALTASSSKRIDYRPPADVVKHALGCSINTFHDRIVLRIYRLWKDVSGNAWFEGGLFLRPYDLPNHKTTTSTDAPQVPTPEKQHLWHHQEVVYDEGSRLILPLSAWQGRCVVLCPSAYRSGRPADLLSSREANQFLLNPGGGGGEPGTQNSNRTSTMAEDGKLFFVCDKLFERTQDTTSSKSYRFDEISPGYLKVNMRPYCFLRRADATAGRATMPRHFTAAQLLEKDGQPIAQLPESTTESTPVIPLGTCTKPKGEKLARVVDWLERKRQLTAAPDKEEPTESSISTVVEVSPPPPPPPLIPRSSPRGRPRGSRGRGRPPRTAPPAIPLPLSTPIIINETVTPPSMSPITDDPVTKVPVPRSPPGRKRLRGNRKAGLTREEMNWQLHIADSTQTTPAVTPIIVTETVQPSVTDTPSDKVETLDTKLTLSNEPSNVISKGQSSPNVDEKSIVPDSSLIVEQKQYVVPADQPETDIASPCDIVIDELVSTASPMPTTSLPSPVSSPTPSSRPTAAAAAASGNRRRKRSVTRKRIASPSKTTEEPALLSDTDVYEPATLLVDEIVLTPTTLNPIMQDALFESVDESQFKQEKTRDLPAETIKADELVAPTICHSETVHSVTPLEALSFSSVEVEHSTVEPSDTTNSPCQTMTLCEPVNVCLTETTCLCEIARYDELLGQTELTVLPDVISSNVISPLKADCIKVEVSFGATNESVPEMDHSNGIEPVSEMSNSTETEPVAQMNNSVETDSVSQMETELVSEMGNSDETELVPEIGDSSEAQPVPEIGNTNETEPVAEMGNSDETKLVPEMGDSIENEPVPEIGNTNETEPVAEMGNSDETKLVPEMGDSIENEPVPEIGNTNETEPVAEMGNSDETKLVPEMGDSIETEPVSEIGNTNETEPVAEMSNSDETEIGDSIEVEPALEIGNTNETESVPKMNNSIEIKPVAEMGNSDETELVPEIGDSIEAEPVPEIGNTNDTEPVAEMGNSDETKLVPDMGDSIETEPVPEIGNTNETESVPKMDNSIEIKPVAEMGNSDETEPVPELDNPNKTEAVPEMNNLNETQPVSEVDYSIATEAVPELDNPNKTEAVPEMGNSNETKPVSEVDYSIATEPVPELDNSNETEIVPEMNNSIETQPVSETDNSTETEPVHKIDNLNETEPVSKMDNSIETELVCSNGDSDSPGSTAKDPESANDALAKSTQDVVPEVPIENSSAANVPMNNSPSSNANSITSPILQSSTVPFSVDHLASPEPRRHEADSELLDHFEFPQSTELASSPVSVSTPNPSRDTIASDAGNDTLNNNTTMAEEEEETDTTPILDEHAYTDDTVHPTQQLPAELVGCLTADLHALPQFVTPTNNAESSLDKSEESHADTAQEKTERHKSSSRSRRDREERPERRGSHSHHRERGDSERRGNSTSSTSSRIERSGSDRRSSSSGGSSNHHPQQQHRRDYRRREDHRDYVDSHHDRHRLSHSNRHHPDGDYRRQDGEENGHRRSYTGSTAHRPSTKEHGHPDDRVRRSDDQHPRQRDRYQQQQRYRHHPSSSNSYR